MRLAPITMLVAASLAGGCEEQKRTRNSAGSTGLFEDGAKASAKAKVFRFSETDRFMGEARAAVREERWQDAVTASDTVIEHQPANSEAKELNQLARLELPNQQRFAELVAAADARDPAAVARHYQAIAAESRYKERATAALEQAREPFIQAQAAEVAAHVRAGRCDQARRAVQMTTSLFPEARARLDGIAGCRQARGAESEPASVARAEPPPAKPEPPAAKTEPPPAPEPTRVAAAAPSPSSAPAQVIAMPATPPPPRPAITEPVATAPAPAAPAPAPKSLRFVPLSELETLRTAGDRTPALPTEARMRAQHEGIERLTITVKLCVNEKGETILANVMKGSQYPGANDAVLGAIRKWRFRPYRSGGTATSVCSAAVLNYKID